jgi:radical SAM protein with 4Fe4S-binding SPASM domain
MKKKLPLVSIVTVNYNGKKFLNDCFKSLLNLNYPKNKLEIFMVDNGSVDGSVDYVRKKFPNVEIIINNQNNYAKANNLGIRAAKGKYFALINNDVKLDKNWLITLVKTGESDVAIGAVGSKILFPDGSIQSVGHQEHPNFYWVDIGFRDDDKEEYNNIKEVESICGCSVLYRKKCLKEAGLLDEDFNIHLEDVDMAIRCKKKGWKLVTCPDSIIYHKFHSTINEDSAKLWQETNRLLLIAKHWPDKLADALSGKDYFTVKNGFGSDKNISIVLGKVFVKLIKEHGLEVTNRLSDDLFHAVRKIYNFEKSSLIGAIKDKEMLISSLEQQLSDQKQQITLLLNEKQQKDQEIIAKDQELSLKSQEIASVKDALESLKQQKDQEIIAKDQELSLKSQEIASVKDALESLKQQKDQEIISLRSEKQQKEEELKGIYTSTGYRYFLKPLWDFLWPVKQSFKKIRFYAKKIKLLLEFFLFNTKKLFSKNVSLKNKILFFKKKTEFSNVYLNHIYNNTFPLMPKKLILMLTSRCNLNCKFCDIPERRYKKKELTKDEAITIINSVAKLNIEELELTGGEPLLHCDFFDIVAYASSLGLKVTLTTNGVLLKEKADKIIDSKIFFISVSIDGFENSYNELRNCSGIYSQIIEAMDYLKQQGKQVSANFVVTNKNVKQLEELCNFFTKKGIGFSFFPVINKPDLYIRSIDDKRIFMKFVRKLKSEKQISPLLYKYYLNMFRYWTDESLRVRCLGLNRELGVDVDGDLFPCCVWNNENRYVDKLGNLLTDNLDEVWHSKKFHIARLNIFQKGCGGCYNPTICEFSHFIGQDFLLSGKLKEILQNPEHVHLRLTSRCNLSCRHCDIWKANNFEKELKTQEWGKIISKIYDWLGSFRLDLAGGEILLRRDTTDIIRFASNKGIITNLTTNATLIDKVLAKKIIECGLSSLTVSIDAYDAKLHNYVRNNKNAYQLAMKGVSNLRFFQNKKKLIAINIATVIMEFNLGELKKLVMLTNGDEFDSIIFQALDHNFHAPYNQFWFKNNEFWPKDSVKVKKAIDELISLKLKGSKINNSFEQLEAMKRYFDNPLDFNADYKCNTGNRNFIVDEFGQVMLCWNMGAIGNLLIDRPQDIWTNRLSKVRREQIKNCSRTCRILNCNYV